jgi:hypothetical protein
MIDDQHPAAVASRLVSTFLLSQGETILETRVGAAGVLVCTSDRTWMVTALEEAKNFHRGPGYQLYDIHDADMDGPTRSEGVAVLPGGEMFHLNQAAGLQAFFDAVRATLTAEELAALIAFYQSDAPGVESVVADHGDLAWLFPAAQPIPIPALSLPEVEGSPAGSLRLRFCTLYLADDPLDSFTKVNLNRWQVTANGGLTWEVHALARDLNSPRFRP